MYCTHEEHCQYFVITGKGKQPLKTVYTEKKIMDMENRLVVAKREGEGVGWMGNLGLIDENYCLWSGLAMKSCCVALGTMSSHF